LIFVRSLGWNGPLRHNGAIPPGVTRRAAVGRWPVNLMEERNEQLLSDHLRSRIEPSYAIASRIAQCNTDLDRCPVATQPFAARVARRDQGLWFTSMEYRAKASQPRCACRRRTAQGEDK
jgi:hypothetical protein